MLSAYDFYNKKFKESIPGWEATRVAKIIELTGTNKKVLDVGCGGGIIGSQIGMTGNSVYGVDISLSNVKKARSKGIKAKQCNIENDTIPFKTKFDIIVAGEIIEHVFDTENFLKKLRRKLNKDGDLIITTPNAAAFGRRLLLLIGRNPHLEPSADTKYAGHVRYFTKDSLEELLKSTGFKIEVFTSDLVNFDASGSIKSKLLAEICPTLGKTIIVKCAKA